MILTLFPKSNRVNTNFSPKITGYRMYGTYARSIKLLGSNLLLLDKEPQFCGKIHCVDIANQVKQSMIIVFIFLKLNRILYAEYILQGSFCGSVHIILSIQKLSRISLDFWGIFGLSYLKIFYCVMVFFIAVVLGDLRQVFLIFAFLDSNIDTYCKRVIVASLSLPLVPIIFIFSADNLFSSPNLSCWPGPGGWIV